MISIFKRQTFQFLTLFLLTLSTVTFSAHAQTDEQLVQIRLLAERGQIEANDEIWIATEQSIEPHWHTYWKNPGDSGTPTAISWDLPEGFEISEIHWPTPEKIPYGPLLNYGYEDNVVLLQKLKTPAELPSGPIELKADIELLVCKEECIPEYGTYTLTLNGPDANLENNAAFVMNARKQLPIDTDWSVFFGETSETLVLEIQNIPQSLFTNANWNTAEFLPADWGAVDNTARADVKIEDGTLIIEQKRGDRILSEIETLNAVLTFKNEDGSKQSFSFKAQHDGKTPAAISAQAETAVSASIEISFLQAVAFALIGGLILNLMPCVFPVLSIKALSLIKTAEKNPGHARMHGIAYTLGVVLSFLAIAGLLIALKSAGEEIGWGFQLQNPLVVGLLAYLLFILGLNLSGFFEFANPFANTGGKLTQNDGLSGSFFTGILATLVATPCTAPFMASALGYALVQPAALSLTIFAALGFGLALPYLLLSFIPAFQKALPKPGPWMDVFKQILAFPMYAAAIWLVWVLGEQTGSNGMTITLIGMLLITIAIWLIKYKNILAKILAGGAIIAALFAIPMQTSTPEKTTATITNEKFGESFSQEKLNTLLAETKGPVFVEMTAAWCITCKVNNATSISIPSTKKAFAENNVRFLIGDWTNKDPEITKYLDSYGRKGVPLYVFYGAKNADSRQRPDPKILPQILTPQIVQNTLG